MEFKLSEYGRVQLVDKDGVTVFELVPNDDGSLEVRGVDSHKIGSVLHGCCLTVEPKVSNVVLIRTLSWNAP